MRRREVLAAGAGAALVAGLLGRPGAAHAQDDRDAGVLTRALRLEHTSVFACDAVAAAGVLDGDAARRLRVVRAHEAEHAEALARALGALDQPLPEPPERVDQVEVPHVRAALDALEDRRDALALLVEVERLSLQAHRAGVGELREARHVQLLATILATEATHLVAWRAVG